MPGLLLTVLLISLLAKETYVATSLDDENFFKSCSPSRCSKHGPEVRFPFRLATQPPPCGAPGMQLSCSGQDTILYHQVLGSCKVTTIFYKDLVINISPPVDSSLDCPLQRLISANLSTGVYKPQKLDVASLVGCSRDPIPIDLYGIVGPVTCLINKAIKFWYLVNPDAYMSVLPLDCMVVSKDITIPYTSQIDYSDFFIIPKKVEHTATFEYRASRSISLGETAFCWYSSNITSVCQQCEKKGQRCGFNSQRDRAFCKSLSSIICSCICSSFIDVSHNALPLTEVKV
ncbi:unnamed protein product [Triticum turgidum subsp. durum]|uniref:RING-type E3 ubiquitin transferase n=1 Tax=Triticum turgidum subsp. durum TaxID=4567 RepID=A0A9R0R7A0_TRITD|nr:unnamed protein product [Triticum turgidum subsp. durum]